MWNVKKIFSKVRIICADFNRTDIYDKISEQLNDLEVIDVLVNNVGTLYKRPEYFTEIPVQFNNSYLNVNINSYLKLIEMVLPKMVKQNRGIIINISSQTALGPIPLMTTYAATKAFIQFLSEGISIEYESKGVTVQTVLPSMTKTKLLQSGLEKSFFTVNSDDFVRAAFNTVGIESTTFGHWKHKLLGYITERLSLVFGKRPLSRIALKYLKQQRDEFYKTE